MIELSWEEEAANLLQCEIDKDWIGKFYYYSCCPKVCNILFGNILNPLMNPSSEPVIILF